ncbi:MAG: FxLYD domain-containing protein [Eggerthellaceae bacterium]|jgi:predicted nucleic acid-binding Zn ribbon protein
MAEQPTGANQYGKHAAQPADAQNQAPQNTAPTKQCKKCGATIPKYSEVCPNCGKNLKPAYKKAWFWILIVLAIIVIGIGSCSMAVSNSMNVASSPSSSASDSSGSSDSQQSDYSITNEKFKDEGYGSYAISGTFANNSGKEYQYIQLTYALKDSDGNQVGEAFANTSNLGDGEKWKFEAVGFSEGDATAKSYELKDVTSY